MTQVISINRQNLRLPKENLYSNGYIVDLGEEGMLLKRDRLIYNFKSERDVRHRVTAGETLSSLAYRYYNNSLSWFILADVNNIYNPFNLTPGSILLIPDIDIIENLRR
jgi:nucleoid-associated protein YgaU